MWATIQTSFLSLWKRYDDGNGHDDDVDHDDHDNDELHENGKPSTLLLPPCLQPSPYGYYYKQLDYGISSTITHDVSTWLTNDVPTRSTYDDSTRTTLDELTRTAYVVHIANTYDELIRIALYGATGTSFY